MNDLFLAQVQLNLVLVSADVDVNGCTVVHAVGVEEERVVVGRTTGVSGCGSRSQCRTMWP